MRRSASSPEQMPQSSIVGRRAARRRVRLRVSLTINGGEVGGFTRNLSAAGFYALITATDLSSSEISEMPSAGTRVETRIVLDDGDLVRAGGQVAWVDSNDRDVDGRPVLGLGIQLELSDARMAARLKAFVAEFRYTVMWVADDLQSETLVERTLGSEYRILSLSSTADALATFGLAEIAVVVVGAGLTDAPARFLLSVSSAFPRSHAVRLVASGVRHAEDVRELVNRAHVFHVFDTPLTARELLTAVHEAVDSYAVAVENERLSAELDRAKKDLVRENAYLRRRMVGAQGFEAITGKSPRLHEVLDQLERIRRSDTTVHIEGESGTGKELVARALHAGGLRAERPYAILSCAGMTETLSQSTLFGHRKGAFTGADRDHRGVFLEADGGTLFLDEIAELSPHTQAALLRALQEGEIMPVGANKALQVDVRVISASHKNLLEEVRTGRFREDLYFRLVVITVTLPPLRERTGDVALLAGHFLDRSCERHEKEVPGFTPETMLALEAYAWPGNVRELANEIERLVVLADPGQKVSVEMLSPRLMQETSRAPGRGSGQEQGRTAMVRDVTGGRYDDAIAEVERALIRDALSASGGSLTRAAERLGIERSRLGKLRKRLQICAQIGSAEKSEAWGDGNNGPGVREKSPHSNVLISRSDTPEHGERGNSSRPMKRVSKKE